MQKKIILMVSIIGIVTLLTIGAYYITVFSIKQKAATEIAKLDQKIKIEKEKADKANAAQQKIDEESKRQTELLIEEWEKNASEKTINNTAAKNKTAVLANTSATKNETTPLTNAEAQARVNSVNAQAQAKVAEDNAQLAKDKNKYSAAMKKLNDNYNSDLVDMRNEIEKKVIDLLNSGTSLSQAEIQANLTAEYTPKYEELAEEYESNLKDLNKTKYWE